MSGLFRRTIGSEAPPWRFVALAAAAVILLTLLCPCDELPTANELCTDHGGVAQVGGGGWATPLISTCQDGYAGQVGR